jgi:hypothetical protein
MEGRSWSNLTYWSDPAQLAQKRLRQPSNLGGASLPPEKNKDTGVKKRVRAVFRGVHSKA